MSEPQKVLDAYFDWLWNGIDAVDLLIDPDAVLSRLAERTGLPLNEMIKPTLPLHGEDER